MEKNSRNLDIFFEHSCYNTPQTQKEAVLLEELNNLHRHHYEYCEKYRSIDNAYKLASENHKPKQYLAVENLPFLPVRLFKELELKSISKTEVFKTLTSSGTTGQAPSKIFLDANTAKLQTKTLVKILQTFLGKKRLPMLIIDHPSVVKNRLSFSARGAGILGVYNFGRNHTYALKDDTMELDLSSIREFLKSHQSKSILIFGFTFMVWKYFVTELEKTEETIDLSKATLIHSGGWKKLEEEAVDNETFKARLASATGITKVHNFYGMVEQVGSIFMECEKGYLHSPLFSDVIIRDPSNWAVKASGEPGVIQVISALPHSYPGHSLVTEDRGVVYGVDDCECGRLGKYFRVLGRLPSAEVRGCSDTHQQTAS